VPGLAALAAPVTSFLMILVSSQHALVAKGALESPEQLREHTRESGRAALGSWAASSTVRASRKASPTVITSRPQPRSAPGGSDLGRDAESVAVECAD
jgi:hypothetical protein